MGKVVKLEKRKDSALNVPMTKATKEKFQKLVPEFGAMSSLVRLFVDVYVNEEDPLAFEHRLRQVRRKQIVQAGG